MIVESAVKALDRFNQKKHLAVSIEGQIYIVKDFIYNEDFGAVIAELFDVELKPGIPLSE